MFSCKSISCFTNCFSLLARILLKYFFTVSVRKYELGEPYNTGGNTPWLFAVLSLRGLSPSEKRVFSLLFQAYGWKNPIQIIAVFAPMSPDRFQCTP